MPKGLQVAPGLSLPLDYVTMTAAILAQRRKGKTYTASVFAEELYEARMPWVALDPTGAWWGLKSSADGESAGIPIVVIGGQHGDLPLEERAGAIVADLVLDHPGWYVIDLSLLEGRPAEREFATKFGERLHRRKMQAGMDFPLHLFVDEADLFVPQEKETKADVALLAAYQGIVRRGGLHGLGSTLISQRPALVNKNVLTQLDMLVLLRLVAGNDQDAVYKNYVSRFAPKRPRLVDYLREASDVTVYAEDIMDSLATLPVGDAWFLEPGAEPPLMVRSRARERRTFNSSATPKAGEKRVEPKVLAEVDLEALRGRMAATIEKAKADDPVELRRRIRELERDAAVAAQTPPPSIGERTPTLDQVYLEAGWKHPDDPPERVEVPAVPPATVAAVEALLEAGNGFVASLGEWAEKVARSMDGVRAGLRLAADAKSAPAVRAPVEPRRIVSPPAAPRAKPIPVAASSLNGDGDGDVDVELKAGARRILETFARHYPMKMTRAQLGTLAKFKITGGTFSTYWGILKRNGLVVEEGGECWITDAGLERVGHVPREPMGQEEILEMWRGSLKAGARRMLDVVVANPSGLTRDELADAVEMTKTGGTFSTYLGTLRRNNLISEVGDLVAPGEALRSAAYV